MVQIQIQFTSESEFRIHMDRFSKLQTRMSLSRSRKSRSRLGLESQKSRSRLALESQKSRLSLEKIVSTTSLINTYYITSYVSNVYISCLVKIFVNSFLQPKALKMTYWGDKRKLRSNTRCSTMTLLDQMLFVLMRLKVKL